MSLARAVLVVGVTGFALLTLSPQSGGASESASSGTRGGQWPGYNLELNGSRFSPLTQIHPDNANKLGEVCRVQIDGPTSFSAGLVVLDGTIYTTTSRETVALDATTCAVRWKYTYLPDQNEMAASNRGVAVVNGRVFRGTADGRLIALDAATGKLLWKDVIGNPGLGESISVAPAAWQGLVYVGIAGGEFGVKGRVIALDQITGREVWRFNTIPTGREVGAETWSKRNTAKTGGGAVWGAFSIDVSTGELFVPVGNPWPVIDAAHRPGANLFTSSLVVLDARTGALNWWYQLTPNDGRDLDLAAAPVLYRDDKIRDIAAFAGKDGYLRAVDRDTHKLLFRVPVTTIENEGSPATAEGTHICPGFGGGTEWNGPALDTLNGNLITGAVDWCMKIMSGPFKYKAGQHNLAGTIKPDPVASGWLVAVDSQTGKLKWRYHAEKPVVAGVTPTAGGVTFAGDTGGNFLVLDSKTGNLLHKFQTGGALAGGIVTYELAGTQYVAFASGNVSRTTFGALGLPSVIIMALGASASPAQPTGIAAAAVPTRVEGDASKALGRDIFERVCSACHGKAGDMVEGHDLSSVRKRRDLAAVIDFIKSPTPPMPKMFPVLLSNDDVTAVAKYIYSDL